MKKFLFAIGLGLAVNASAQNWLGQEFIADGVASLIVSNGTAKGVTNLLSLLGQGGQGPGTNIALTSWYQQLGDTGSNSYTPTLSAILPPWQTNQFVTNYIVTALDNSTGTNLLATKNLLKSYVSLWSTREGDPVPMWGSQTGTNSLASIAFRIVGASIYATNTVAFLFTGIPWVDENNNAYENTRSGDLINVTIAANGTTPVIMATNLPMGRVIGYKGLRLASITAGSNGDNNGSNQVYVTDVRLIGFKP